MVLRDISVGVFDEYVRNAKAGIIALHLDTGSSGQSVGLARMRNAKCILATRTGGLQQYIEDGVLGCWIDDLATDLPRLIWRTGKQSGASGDHGLRGATALRTNTSPWPLRSRHSRRYWPRCRAAQ